MAIQIRRGTNTEWESNNSNIVVGEPAIATDAERFFVGTASGDYAEFANLDIIAPAYNTSTSYVVGDITNYHGKLYSCNTPCSGAFNISYWDEKSLAEILKDLESEINYAQYEIGYANGKLIMIDNGASEIPVKDLTLDIDAVQDLHGYDAPWVGGAGKNLLDQSAYTALTGCTYSNGKFTANVQSNCNGVMVRYFDANNQAVDTVLKTVGEQGSRCSIPIVVDDTWATMLIGYNMSGNNIAAKFPKPSANGNYVVSFTLDKIPTTSVYGEFSNIQVESGTTATDYAPYSNICPISGWDEVNVTRTGKNLYGGLDFAQALVDYGYQTILDTRAQTVSFTRASIIDGKYTHNLFDKFPSSTATAIITYLNSGNNTSLIFTYSDGSYTSITLPPTNGEKAAVVVRTNADKTVIGMNLSYYAENRTVIYYNESGIFDGHIITADQFEPYNRHVYPVTWEEAGTVYGGTLDVTTGVLTVTHSYVELNIYKWTKNWSSGNPTGIFYTQVISTAKESGHCICDSYKVVNNVNPNSMDNGCITMFSNSRLYAKNTDYTDGTAFKSSLSGKYIVYELATPQVVQLTPTQVRTLLGTNNLWNQMNSNNELAYRISNALN